MKTLIDSLKTRRSYYHLSPESPISDDRIIELINLAVYHCPSALNMQSSRVILLLNDHHKQLWDIVKKNLKPMVSEEQFKKTEAKIDMSFASGYATILFFDDVDVTQKYAEQNSFIKDQFPGFAQQTNGMIQHIVWMLLEDEGMGVNLQHYNPVIDEEVKKNWGVQDSWKLIAQMPIGTPTKDPDDKTFEDIHERMKIMK